MKTKSKISSLRISPIFGPKSGEDQKKISSLKFSPVFGAKSKKRSSIKFCPFRVLKLSAQVTKGGGACRNFACYSMLIIVSWRPKGGSMTLCPPKYAPCSLLFALVETHYTGMNFQSLIKAFTLTMMKSFESTLILVTFLRPWIFIVTPIIFAW